MIECKFLNKLLLYCGYHSLVQEDFQRNTSFNIVEIASETLEKTHMRLLGSFLFLCKNGSPFNLNAIIHETS